MKHILSLTTAIALSAATVMANPDWKMHPTFDDAVTRVIDTKDAVYFTSRVQPYVTWIPDYATEQLSLFRYDKNADEIETLSTDNMLSSNNVAAVQYSPEKKYLIVAHLNGDIDVIHDSGKVDNIPALRLASIDKGKTVNSIFIDAPRDRAYLSTGFGYVAVNVSKKEIAESRNYDHSVKGISRVGDNLVLLLTDGVVYAPISEPRYTLDSYKRLLSFPNGSSIAAVGEERTIVVDRNFDLYDITLGEDGHLSQKYLWRGSFGTVAPNERGVLLTDGPTVYLFKKDGSHESIVRPESHRNYALDSRDFSEIWEGNMRQGLSSWKLPDDREGMPTMTRDWMLPNSPAPYRSTCMRWHDRYGLLVCNPGLDGHFQKIAPQPALLSAYKDGLWSNPCSAYSDFDAVQRLNNPNGFAIDPDNPDYIYFSSHLHGIKRVDLTDLSKELHLSRELDPYRDLEGFVAVVGEQTGKDAWPGSCTFSVPEFDKHGNMWTIYTDLDDQTPKQIHLFCWEAADRRASTSAKDYRPMKMLRIPGPLSNPIQMLKALKVGKNDGILIQSNHGYTGDITIIDTAGTPTDQSDDTVKILSSFSDQDGQPFEVHYTQCFFEDPSTGNVWVGHNGGVFYFNPRDVMAGKGTMNRVKVSRNDGTNLADYLLNLIEVNNITVDGSGRKWFSTSGGGVVCTSSDGRTILEELTTDNSPLPDNTVYATAWDPSRSTLMISTDKGMAEYRPTSSGGNSASDSDLRIYPNPVRPDFLGYVTIEGLPDKTLVKIIDASGNLVKELGLCSKEARWDVTDVHFRRAGTGVYFVLSSTDENGGNFANVGKILVVN